MTIMTEPLKRKYPIETEDNSSKRRKLILPLEKVLKSVSITLVH